MRSLSGSLLLAAVSVAALTSPARSAWNPSGATILPTTDHLQPVSSCSDGGYGTFVAWQQAPTKGAAGVLRLQHVLPTGDVDPSWAASGAVVCGVSVVRTMLGALPDRQGGIYLWWKENTSLYATRMTAGAVAPGWPARGRLLGMIHDGSPAPSAIEDGAHGFYAAWVAETPGPDDFLHVLGVHLGPANTGAGGWGSGTRSVVPPTPFDTEERWPQLALAPDGGLFLAFAQISSDEGALATAFRLRRLTAAGGNAAGWSSEGLIVHPYDKTILTSPYPISLVSIAPDGRGGLFVLAGNPTNDSNYPMVDAKIYRLLADGSSAADWPAAGRNAARWGGTPPIGYWGSSDASMRVLADGADGAVIGMQAILTDSPMLINYQGMSATGTWGEQAYGSSEGHEIITAGAGRTYLATYSPDGPYSMWDEIAYISVAGVPTGGTYAEYHNEPVVLWFGDVSVASSGDGGAIFYWSQVRDRFGLFARRMTPGGEVTGVGDRTLSAVELRGLRWINGRGVVARIDAVAGSRIELFDVAGRRVASERLDQAGARELTMPGTMALAPGLYLARLAGAGVVRNGRVMVTR